MTLDEAIIHAEEVAKNKEKAIKLAKCNPENPMLSMSEKGINEYKQCISEHRQLAEWLKELKMLREKDRWIPCGERLPKEHEWIGTKRFGRTISKEVYVTFEMPDGQRFTKHLSFQNGELSSSDKMDINAFFKGAVPIAWRELPEPYKGESE